MEAEASKRRSFPSFQNVHNEAKLYHELYLAYNLALIIWVLSIFLDSTTGYS